ncbi:hypothetical protein [uncultured Desulfuromusa sp.]|uniref:hypothetical protein n=1 Tax=uncultured Desulfuromusa sp. TaxID=219183 RepID=UPI002AA68623|nr:hypothetical protein [uncultured Desulfuromusa sp.]
MNNTMKCLSFILLVQFFFIGGILFAADDQEWQVRGRSETLLEWQDVSGNSGSSLEEGTTWRQELSIALQKQIEAGQVGLDLRGRATNNEQVDNRDARLMYLRGFYRTEKLHLELGDVAASYNPMVLSTSARGAKVAYQIGDRDNGWDFGLIGGLQKATWEELYDSTSDESVDRYVAGIKTTWSHAPAQSVGAAISFVKDDSATADNGGALAIDSVESKTAGVDWNWRFNRYLSIRGETAYNQSDLNTSDSTDDDDAGAIRIKVYSKPLPRSLRVNFLYERFDTDFKPVIASASADRERFENDTEWMISREFKARLTLKHSQDNLDGALGDTLYTRDAVLYLTYRPDWMKRGDFGVRMQGKRNSGRGSDQNMQIVSVDFNNRPKSGWRYGTSYILTLIDDNAAGAEDQQINTMRGILGWKKRLADDHMVRATVTLDGNFINKNSGDQVGVGGRIDCGYDAGNLWSMDLFASTKNNGNDAAADTQYINYQFRADYHPGSDRSKSIRLSAERREYDSDDTTTDQDYQEHLVKLAYLFTF